MAASAGIIVIGNEILTGKVRDDNSAFLIRELRSLGTPVERVVVIPDIVETIAEAVREFSVGFTFVFTTGGVGPTLDDVSHEGIARAFGEDLVEHPELAEVIRRHFGATTTAAHLKMARLPRSGVLHWPDGLPWPVVTVKNVMVLPGDPGILQKKFHAVRERFRGTPFTLRRLFTRLEEGLLSPHLDAVFAEYPDVSVGSYPVYDHPEYSVQVTLESKDAARVESALASLVGRIGAEAIVRVL